MLCKRRSLTDLQGRTDVITVGVNACMVIVCIQRKHFYVLNRLLNEEK